VRLKEPRELTPEGRARLGARVQEIPHTSGRSKRQGGHRARRIALPIPIPFPFPFPVPFPFPFPLPFPRSDSLGEYVQPSSAIRVGHGA
jgi:hypothetical protein